MDPEMEILILDPRLKRGLPIAFARIFVSRAILDESKASRLTLDLSRYRHRTTFVRPPDKPISKPEL
jgi:hypothetical protein